MGQLRNKIYRYCFVLDERIDIEMEQSIDNDTMARRCVEGANPWWTKLDKPEASAHLLRVSKTVFAEAYTILYFENSFCFDGHATLG